MAKKKRGGGSSRGAKGRQVLMEKAKARREAKLALTLEKQDDSNLNENEILEKDASDANGVVEPKQDVNEENHSDNINTNGEYDNQKFNLDADDYDNDSEVIKVIEIIDDTQIGLDDEQQNTDDFYEGKKFTFMEIDDESNNDITDNIDNEKENINKNNDNLVVEDDSISQLSIQPSIDDNGSESCINESNSEDISNDEKNLNNKNIENLPLNENDQSTCLDDDDDQDSSNEKNSDESNEREIFCIIENDSNCQDVQSIESEIKEIKLNDKEDQKINITEKTEKIDDKEKSQLRNFSSITLDRSIIDKLDLSILSKLEINRLIPPMATKNDELKIIQTPILPISQNNLIIPTINSNIYAEAYAGLSSEVKNHIFEALMRTKTVPLNSTSNSVELPTAVERVRIKPQQLNWNKEIKDETNSENHNHIEISPVATQSSSSSDTINKNNSDINSTKNDSSEQKKLIKKYKKKMKTKKKLKNVEKHKKKSGDKDEDETEKSIRRSTRIKTISQTRQKSHGRGLVKDKDRFMSSQEINDYDNDNDNEKILDNYNSLHNDLTKRLQPGKLKSRWRESCELEMTTGITSTSSLITNNSNGIATEVLNNDSNENNSNQETEINIIDKEAQLKKLKDDEEKHLKNLKEIELRLSQFTKIKENIYHCDKNISKEAKKMTCDCFLTKEEIERGELGCGEDCLNRLLMIECGNRCIVGDRCTNRRFQKIQYSLCEIVNTEKKGFGIKASLNIPPGEFIMEYVGEVLNSKQFQKRANEYSKDKNKHYYFMALRSDAIIDATGKGNISRFINHSCNPNAETQKWTVNGELRIGFFSTRKIKRNEEITFDYQFQRYGKEAQKCFCEASNCRGWIGEEPDSGGDYDDEDFDDDDDESDNDSINSFDTDKTKLNNNQLNELTKRTSTKSTTSITSMTLEEQESDRAANTITSIANKLEQIKQISELKQKKKERKLNLANKRKIKKKALRSEILDDIDIDDEIINLNRTGLKNQAHTLKLSRLMVRAKLMDTRIKLLNLVCNGELPCRRLFLDYHGLKLLYGWISDTELIKEFLDNLKFQLKILETLKILPIINKTMLKDSKVYNIIEKWCIIENIVNKEILQKKSELINKTIINDSPSDNSGSGTPIPIQSDDNIINTKVLSHNHIDENSDNKLNNIGIDIKKLPTDNTIKQNKEQPNDDQNNSINEFYNLKEKRKQLSIELIKLWKNLPEVFRIPKKERIEQMKEHEREADLTYKALGLVDDEQDLKYTNRYRDRNREKDRDNKDSRIPITTASLASAVITISTTSAVTKDKKYDSKDPMHWTNSGHTKQPIDKHQRRQLFEMKFARQQEEKKKVEFWRIHDATCRCFGLDPRAVRPADVPVMVNPATGQWYTHDHRPIATPPSHAHIKPPEPDMSTNPEDYNIPTMDLPPFWEFAINQSGQIYFYHTKIRIPQWDPPIYIEPLIDESKPVEEEQEDITEREGCGEFDDEIVKEGELVGEEEFEEGNYDYDDDYDNDDDDDYEEGENNNEVNVANLSESEKSSATDTCDSSEEELIKQITLLKKRIEKHKNYKKMPRYTEEISDELADSIVKETATEHKNSNLIDIKLHDTLPINPLGCVSPIKSRSRPKKRKNRINLCETRLISPRKEEDRIYGQQQSKLYKETKEKLRRRKEEVKRKKILTTPDTTTTPDPLTGIKKITKLTEGLPIIPIDTCSEFDNSNLTQQIPTIITTPVTALITVPITETLPIIKTHNNHENDYDLVESLIKNKMEDDHRLLDGFDDNYKDDIIKKPQQTHPGSYDEWKRQQTKHKLDYKKRDNSRLLTDDSEKDSPKHVSKRRRTATPTNTVTSNDRDHVNSDEARRIKEKFRGDIAGVIVQHLGPYRKETCQIGRIETNEDFKHLARKLTHFVMLKELKHRDNTVNILEVTESVKIKAREFIKKYMAKYGCTYQRGENEPDFKD